MATEFRDTLLLHDVSIMGQAQSYIGNLATAWTVTHVGVSGTRAVNGLQSDVQVVANTVATLVYDLQMQGLLPL